MEQQSSNEPAPNVNPFLRTTESNTIHQSNVFDTSGSLVSNQSESSTPKTSAFNIFGGKINQPRSSVVAPQSGIFTPASSFSASSSGSQNPFANYTRIARKRQSFESDGTPIAPKSKKPIFKAGPNKLFSSAFRSITSTSTPGSTSITPSTRSPEDQQTLKLFGVKKTLAKTKLRRISTSTDPTAANTSCAILCANMPLELIKKDLLEEHFSKFGKIQKLVTNSSKQTALIFFETHEEATNAKRKGTNISAEHSPLKIYYVKSHGKTADRTPTAASSHHSAPLSWVSPTSNNDGFALYAKTDKEKLEMLEKIDLMLRKQVVKQSDIKSAKVFKGTCEDMCPEKERYLRQERNILAPYETSTENPQQVDHTKAIKEYSRSSADQEEPLPHDLRPSSVMHTAMLYILINIMPKIMDGDVAEWYDFIWNRTRALRKELSIQQTKDPLAIELTEQCARFHIFCAHHLAEEDRMNFDPKINNENLEKTMKTLLDMYHDIKDNSNDPKPRDSFFEEPTNQAEFYGYYILLNINKTADVLRELQQMSGILRLSNDVQLAVAAFMALHNGNYSKFFKIAKKATYLQASLMHRYFNQVRQSAFRMMSRAYVPKQQTPIPCSKLIDSLCFNDENELFEFCDHYSMAYNENEVMITRNGIESTESSIRILKSEIISEKLYSLNDLGDLIAGKRLPTWEEINYRPTTSFDERGRYIGKHSQLLKSGKGFLANEEKTVTPPAAEKKMSIADIAAARSITKEIFHNVIDEFCLSISEKCIFTETLAQEIYFDVTQETLDVLTLTVAAKAIKDRMVERERELKLKLMKQKEREEKSKREREEKQRQEILLKEKEEFKEHYSMVLQMELIKDVCAKIVKEVSIEVYKELKEMRRRNNIENLSTYFYHILADSFCEDYCQAVAEQEWETAKKIKCENSSKDFQLYRLGNYWKKWKAEKYKIVKFQNAKKTFPGTPYYRSTQNEVDNLTSRHNQMNKNSFAIAYTNVSLLSPVSLHDKHKAITEKLDSAARYNESLHKHAVNKIPFENIINTLHNKQQFINRQTFGTSLNITCKITNIMSTNSQSSIVRWYKKLFLTDPAKGNYEVSLTNFDENGKQNDNAIKYKIAVCSQVLCSTEITCDACRGSSVIIFTIAPKTHVSWLAQRDLLGQLLDSEPRNTPIPLMVVLLDCNLDTTIVADELMLENATMISMYSVVSLDSSCSENKNYFTLIKAMESVMIQMPPPPALIRQSFRDFLESHIPIKYVIPLYRHIAQREELNLPTLSPSVQISLYNSVISSLNNYVSNYDLMSISWPGSEFNKFADELNMPDSNWNSEDNVSKLSNIINMAIVPDFSVSRNASVGEILDCLLSFADAVSPNSIILKNQIKVKAHEQFEKFDMADNLVDLFPWSWFVETVISQHLTNILYHNETGDAMLWFDPIDINTLSIVKTEFQDLQSETEFNSLNTVSTNNPEPYGAAAMDFVKKPTNELLESKAEKSESIHFSKEDLLSKGVSDIRAEIEIEKQLNLDFNNRLQKILQDGELPLNIFHTNTFLQSFNTKK